MNEEPTKKTGRLIRFRNWLSLVGLVLIAGSMFAFVFLFAMELFGPQSNPYMGILTYVVAPMFFFTGLFLFLLGAWIQRRRTAAGRHYALTIDLSRIRDKRLLVVYIICTLGFLLLTATGSYQTYHITESNQFCGQACHGPMKPENTAHLDGAHARVDCVECHVGRGAQWYVKSKINGVRQLYCTISGNIDRPIPTPVRNLRPARETCEQCHWPAKFTGNLDRTFTHYLSDETNTPFAVRLLLKVGGGGSPHGPPGGIHWHMNPGTKIEYFAMDEQRQVIPYVRVTSTNGQVTEYIADGYKGVPAGSNLRVMDCLDCHNRPAHNYLPPNDSVDTAMSLGRIDPSIPWIKSNVVSVLIQSYPTEAAALKSIDSTLHARYPSQPAIDTVVAATQDIFSRNFFPEMKADWRVYPNNIGHKNWPGCFRCHDGNHKTADGTKTIAASDCNACHIILAEGSGAQLDDLHAQGSAFIHIDSEYSGFDCSSCHTGAFTK
jgi:nitrate/TMAO reductase-like tetraheme cytochrome c subunit